MALLQLAAPLSASPVRLGGALMPITVGQRLTIVGMGVAVRGDGRSGGVARAASLSVTGRPGTLQIRLVDPATNNARAGLGACTGVTPLALYRDWIIRTARSWGAGV